MQRFIINSYLDLSLWLREFIARAEFARENEESASSTLIQQESQAELMAKSSQLLADFIKKYLRLYPYWSPGHLRLGELALEQNDIALAYASAMAARLLGVRAGEELRLNLLLGRSYLRSGAHESAAQIFENALKSAPHNTQLKEELAAAFIPQGKVREARDLLQSIPQDQISQEGMTALTYLSGRLSK